MYDVLAEVVRNGFVESRHYGSVAGLAPDGTLAHARGDVAETVCRAPRPSRSRRSPACGPARRWRASASRSRRAATPARTST